MDLYTDFVQEIRNSGAIGYKYITVDEDEAANVIYANNVLLHLANEQIPRGSAVGDLTFCESCDFNCIVHAQPKYLHSVEVRYFGYCSVYSSFGMILCISSDTSALITVSAVARVVVCKYVSVC